MPDLRLTKTRLVAGVWEGVLSGSGTDTPHLKVTHLDDTLSGVEVQPVDRGEWVVRVPIPATLISDGIQTFVIADADTGDRLNTFALIAGEALADDLRAEIDLLRAELDILKRAFRRHCVETR